MRMMEHSAGPGLEHGDEAAFATEVFGLAKQIAQGLSALGEQGVVELTRVSQAMAAQSLGYGEGDQVVRHRQEAGFLRGGPVLLIASAALWTVAMVAAVELIASARAVRTVIEMAAAPGRAAAEHGLNSAPVVRGDGTLGLRDIVRPVLAEEIRELHFLRPSLRAA